MGFMSNHEDADRAINDPSEWGTPERARKSERRQRSAVVSVRMTAAELEAVQARSALVGQTVGSFMRECALSGSASTHLVHKLAFVFAKNESPTASGITPVRTPAGTGTSFSLTA